MAPLVATGEVVIPPGAEALSFDYHFMTDEDVENGFTTSDDVFLGRLDIPEDGFEEQIAAENASSIDLDAPTPEDVTFDFVSPEIQTATGLIEPLGEERVGRVALEISDDADARFGGVLRRPDAVVRPERRLVTNSSWILVG